MQFTDNLTTDPATAVYDAIQAFNATQPKVFPPFLIWFGPASPPAGYKRLAYELWGVPMYVKAMAGYETALVEQTADGPPPGYFRPGDFGPHAGAFADYWFVSKKYLVPIAADGSSMPPMDKMYLNPGLSNFPAGHALLIGKCFLPVPGCPVPEPVFDPSYGAGQATQTGVRRVVVLFKPMVTPFGAVVAGGDFLFLANEANWVLQNTSSTPAGGSETVNITVGFSQFDSASFYADSKIETTVDVGVVAKIFSFGTSTDVSNEMSVSVIHNESHSSEVTVDITVHFPDSDLTQFWQGYSTMVLYASDGTIVAQATNMSRDTRLTWQRQTGAAGIGQDRPFLISAPSSTE